MTPSERERLDNELAEIIQECSALDWNGYGALPIDFTSVKYIVDFLGKIPEGISMPELNAEPSGDLTMIWRKRGYHVVFGIDKLGLMAWGGTTPTGRVHGEALIDGEIPERVLNLLYEIEGIKSENKNQ